MGESKGFVGEKAVNFETWWEDAELDIYALRTKEIAYDAWQAAQEACKKQLDDELTAAFMMGYQAAKNDYGMGKDA